MAESARSAFPIIVCDDVPALVAFYRILDPTGVDVVLGAPVANVSRTSSRRNPGAHRGTRRVALRGVFS